MERQRFARTHAAVLQRLLAEQLPEGYWLGELAPSALATATAVSALSVWAQHVGFAPDGLRQLVQQGVTWLLQNQNDDGGWGDTPCSASNISTTLLVRSALQLALSLPAEPIAQGQPSAITAADKRATSYLDRLCGHGAAAHAEAIRRRYGQDRTFSVPILMNAALAGLVPWQEVPHLPFELAIFPQSWYRFLRLPVVSYALPALIAIGQAVLHHRGGRLARAWRCWAIEPTLYRLRRMQPESGGFLEAVPLTAFVVMALASTGKHDHIVCRRGIKFLSTSVRPDGSWPIDSNLSVWLTTLSVVALGADNIPNREAVKRWILQQQVKRQHPYTAAEPGGWGWSHLSGSVPDVDDTSGALLALAELSGGQVGVDDARAVFQGLRWLLHLQNADGGWPTFCRGWGRLPFDRSAADLTAHALRALAAWWPALKRWRHSMDPSLRVPAAQLLGRIPPAVRTALHFLRKHQLSDGAWEPLWFGNETAPDEANLTYGTSRVLHAWVAWNLANDAAARRAVQWLLKAQNRDGSWGGHVGVPGSVEETALATDALLVWLEQVPKRHGEWSVSASIDRGLAWLLDTVEAGDLSPTPIGLYFARLWYFERLYPIIFVTQALRRAFRILFHTPEESQARH